MDLVASLSPTLWDLLQRTRLRPDVALELFDGSLTPLLPASEDPRCKAIRQAAAIRFYVGGEVSFQAVLQSGREARLVVGECAVTLMPIRVDGQPVALLAAVIRRVDEGASAEWVDAGPPETAARAWRDALEGDLASVKRARGQEQHVHFARAQASFVADLQQYTTEADLLNALLQAIALWHDVEPCAYTRDLGGMFTLRATLPGTDPADVPPSLKAAAVMDAAAAEGMGSWPLKTQLGWTGRGTPLPLLVSSGSLEEWLIAISGTCEADLSRRVEPLLKGLPMGLERVREREARQLRHDLWQTMASQAGRRDPEAVAPELLATVARAVEATHGVLAVGPAAEFASGVARDALARDSMRGQRDGMFSAQAISVGFPLPEGRFASLELRRTDRHSFRASHATMALAVRPLLGAWLCGLGAAAEWTARLAAEGPARVLRFLESAPETRS